MKFSQRIGKSAKSEIIQTDSMDEALKNRLFNTIRDILEETYTQIEGYIYIKRDFLNIYCDTFGEKITEHDGKFHSFIKNFEYKVYVNDDIWFFYDFIEWLLSQKFYNYEYYSQKINRILKEERSAYLLDADYEFIKITDEIELEEINSSIEKTKMFIGVSEHLSRARESYANRESPNYKNCVRESILGIESLVKIIVDDKNATLETAVKRIPNLNENLKQSLIKLYHFRGDEGGVAHGNKQDQKSEVTEFEAKLILVNSHSLVNYLMATFLTDSN